MTRAACLLVVPALGLALGACGGGDAGSGTTAPAASMTQPATTPAGQVATTTANTGTNAQTTTIQPGTTTSASGGSSPQRAVIAPEGQPTTVAPGTRQACIKKWAPQFPAGQARQAILSQCRNLPR